MAKWKLCKADRDENGDNNDDKHGTAMEHTNTYRVVHYIRTRYSDMHHVVHSTQVLRQISFNLTFIFIIERNIKYFELLPFLSCEGCFQQDTPYILIASFSP